MSSSSDKPQKSGSGWGGNPKSGSCCIRIFPICWRKRLEKVRHKLFDSEGGEDDPWVTQMKGSLGLTASIIATLTFQLATNPPGGVVQASLDDEARCALRYGVYMCAGEAYLAVIHKTTYLAFLICDTISFLASLHVCILLLSGIPLKGPFLIWLLSMGMWVSVTNLALTYLFAASMVTPASIWPSVVGNGFGVAVVFWVSVIVISSAYIIVHPPWSNTSSITSENQDGRPTSSNISKSQELVGRSV